MGTDADRRAIASLPLAGTVVDLDELGEVHFFAERAEDRLEVLRQSVRGDLRMRSDPRRKIGHEQTSGLGVRCPMYQLGTSFVS
jgi:hypothetical protein